MTVNVRHDVPKTPITPQHGLLVGNAPRKLNSLGKYLASAISVNVIFLHVCLSASAVITDWAKGNGSLPGRLIEDKSSLGDQ